MYPITQMEPPMADAQARKKGKQKIEMKRIESLEDRLITFSKRRSGIYKKATEISTLCAAEVGVLMFSPAGKPFSFGVPNIETIANRLMDREVEDNNGGGISKSVVEAYRKAKVERLNISCDELSVEEQRLKNEAAMLAEEVKEKLKEDGEEKAFWWWDVPVEDLNAAEMEQMIVTMEEMNRSAGNRLRDLRAAAASSSSNAIPVNEMEMVPAPADFGGGVPPPPPMAFADPNAFGFDYGNGGY